MGMSSGGGGGSRLPTSMAEINVTPLVDVMLVLLIIFMVTASAETVRAENELEQSRVERDLVPPKKEEPKSPLKSVPIAVPNTQVKEVQENEQKEPRVVLDRNVAFRLDETIAVDCVTYNPKFANLPRDADDAQLTADFERCAKDAAIKFGNNAMIKEKARVNFAADRTIPFGWAAQFMTIMGVQYGIKQVNLVMTNEDTPPPPGGPEAPK
jgi:biopolymer transport protein ExbD